MSDDTALSIQRLSKDFLLPHERKSSIKEWVLHFNKPTYEKLHALRDINVEVKKGEFFGIVGRNGSGKSTLLKIIGGIYQPTKGSVTVNGTLTPFIELGIGFNPELTGRENVFMNGAILGLTRKEVRQRYDEIVKFAELEKFMDQKLKNYSSGMQVRLAFSIAIQAHNDVLLIDEVLAVGDTNFQRKCYKVFKDIKAAGKTVIFVTHDMGAVQEYCDRAMMIENSRIVTIGKPREVALRYELANSADNDSSLGTSLRPENPVVKLDDIKLKSKKAVYSQDDEIEATVDFTVREKTELQFNLFLVKPDGRYVAGANSTVALPKFAPEPGKHRISFTVDPKQLGKGDYRMNMALYTYCKWPSTEVPDLIDVLDTAYGVRTPRFTIVDSLPSNNGDFNMRGKWKEERG